MTGSQTAKRFIFLVFADANSEEQNLWQQNRKTCTKCSV